MNDHDDGGPAFPGGLFRTVQRVGEEPRDIPAGPQGMSLRDWFAGQALVGLLSSDREEEQISFSGYVFMAYDIADEMLAARKAKP
jgi:hypothetical protein